MASEHFNADVSNQTLAEAFPDVVPNVVPLGTRVLVQMRRQATKTKSGLVLVEETKETIKWNGQVAKVVAMGSVAYCNRETGQPWPEGRWVEVGEYVRAPRWGGDRIEVPVKDEDPVIFVTFQDHEIISKVVGDPLAIKTYIL